MKKKINYTDEPKDGAELPESGYEVVSRSTIAKKWKELAFYELGYDQLQKGEKIQLVPMRGGSPQGSGAEALRPCAAAALHISSHARKDRSHCET